MNAVGPSARAVPAATASSSASSTWRPAGGNRGGAGRWAASPGQVQHTMGDASHSRSARTEGRTRGHAPTHPSHDRLIVRFQATASLQNGGCLQVCNLIGGRQLRRQLRRRRRLAQLADAQSAGGKRSPGLKCVARLSCARRRHRLKPPAARSAQSQATQLAGWLPQPPAQPTRSSALDGSGQGCRGMRDTASWLQDTDLCSCFKVEPL